MVKKEIVAAIFIFIFSLLQNTLFSALSLGGIAPDLIMILAVSYGFMLGRKAGLFVGFTAGFIMDLFFGVVLGFYALCYMFVGFFAGHFHEPFFKEDIRLPLGMVVIGELGYNFVFYIIQFLLRGRFQLPFYFLHIMIPKVIYTVVLTLVLYPVILFVNRKLDELEKKGAKKLD